MHGYSEQQLGSEGELTTVKMYSGKKFGKSKARMKKRKKKEL